MTVQELIDHCKEQGISLDTQIALRAKDDYMLEPEMAYLGDPYFGNCGAGQMWMNENSPRDEDGDIDYDNTPDFLILNTGRG